MGVLEERKRRRSELQDILDAVEAGRLLVGIPPLRRNTSVCFANRSSFLIRS